MRPIRLVLSVTEDGGKRVQVKQRVTKFKSINRAEVWVKPGVDFGKDLENTIKQVTGERDLVQD